MLQNRRPASLLLTIFSALGGRVGRFVQRSVIFDLTRTPQLIHEAKKNTFNMVFFLLSRCDPDHAGVGSLRPCNEMVRYKRVLLLRVS